MKTQTEHPDRKAARIAYEATLEAARVASYGNSEDSYDAANAAVEEARAALVKAEIEHPLSKEIKKRNEYLQYANRGLDVF